MGEAKYIYFTCLKNLSKMANSGSILGFVNQLQNMELQMANILMEAAMKLASMTDANVFMLVEHAGGRYFSGKRHLCDSYLSHQLSPIGNDVEMEINPDISALQERPHCFFPQSSPVPSQSTDLQRGSSPRKRSLTNHLPPPPNSASSPSKRRRGSDHAGPSSLPSVTNDLKREVMTDGFVIQDNGAYGEGVGDANLDNSFSLVDQSSYDAGNSSDADIICGEEEGMYAITATSTTTPESRRRHSSPRTSSLEESDALAVISDTDKQ